MKNPASQPTLLTILLIFCATIALAQSKKTKVAQSPIPDAAMVKQLAYTDSARLAAIFKDLHAHPELAFMETRTAAIIAKELQTLGYQVITGIGKTGLAGILKNGDGPVVMYRADMDGLPIKETAPLAYASTDSVFKVDGSKHPSMHACGHDAHMTWMLGIAKLMVDIKSQWKGTLVFVAQPAEEVGAGAKTMIQDGLYNRGVPEPDYLFGMHTFPFAVGYISNAPGVRMSGVDMFDVTFYGIGGHGSAPHLAKDPVIMAASAILDYQSVVSRSVSAQSPHVITVGSVLAGSANNIIPESATLKVGIRWFSEADRQTMRLGINKVDSGIALANNLPPNLYPKVTERGFAYPVKNDTAMTARINTTLGQLMPHDHNLLDRPAWMASEDFPFLIGDKKKNAVYDYMFVGVANPAWFDRAVAAGKEYPFFNHNPNFEIDLAAIPFGVAVGATSVLELFRK